MTEGRESVQFSGHPSKSLCRYKEYCNISRPPHSSHLELSRALWDADLASSFPGPQFSSCVPVTDNNIGPRLWCYFFLLPGCVAKPLLPFCYPHFTSSLPFSSLSCHYEHPLPSPTPAWWMRTAWRRTLHSCCWGFSTADTAWKCWTETEWVLHWNHVREVVKFSSADTIFKIHVSKLAFVLWLEP